jgi:Na+/melibiose symporter-like transporter
MNPDILITSREFAEAQRVVVSNLHRRNRVAAVIHWLSFGITLLLIAFTVPLILSLVDRLNTKGFNWTVVGIGLLAIAYLLQAFILQPMYARLVSRHLSLQDPTAVAPVQLEVNDEYLRTESPAMQTAISWKHVQVVSRSKARTILSIGTAQALVVPARCFGSEGAYEAFVFELVSHAERERA